MHSHPFCIFLAFSHNQSNLQSPIDQEKKFRDIVVSLSEALTESETNILVYTHSLPEEYNNKKPLVVLQLMHNRDLFSAAKPDRLATLMKEINRMDLAIIVEKYIQKTQKRVKPHAQLKSSTSVTDVESDLSLFVRVQAKLEVTSIQTDIIAMALDEALKTVSTSSSLKRVEEIMQDAKVQTEKLCRLVSHAQDLSRSTPQSNGNNYCILQAHNMIKISCTYHHRVR